MRLEPFDWWIIGACLVVWLVIGIAATKRASKSAGEFFLSGRSMPWWLLGVSMVATTFSTDTPNLVTGIVRKDGVAGNWIWWAFLLTGMLTTFVYARLWRRLGVSTDIEFYEVRYSGPAAAFLRGFRTIYLGVIFNVMIMATVTLAAIKIGGVMFAASPQQVVFVAALVTVVYSMAGGLTGVLWTDFVQFFTAMVGAVAAAVVVLSLPQVGGLDGLLSHPNVVGKLSFFPPVDNAALFVGLLIVPLAVQWWSAYYPGAEPGGGGYLVQRMLAAEKPSDAQGASLLFNVAHYALRPWPWIIVALASLIVFPDLDSLRAAFPHVSENVMGDDLAYSAMLTFMPAGLLGLVLASLAAAYMSTISTHLNWGSSYLVFDFYKRFLNPEASERQMVFVGRVSTAALMIMAAVLALYLETATDAFFLILQIGAGTGLLFIMRWFWLRINPWSEITAMVVSLAVAIVFQFVGDDLLWGDVGALLIGTAITTVAWVVVTLRTPPSPPETIAEFKERSRVREIDVGASVSCIVLGTVFVYSALFSTGKFIYGEPLVGGILAAIAVVAAALVVRNWPRD